MEGVFASVEPDDFIEAMLSRQYVDNMWEAFRMMRLRSKFWRSKAMKEHFRLADITANLSLKPKSMSSRRRGAAKEFAAADWDGIYADIFVSQICVFERFDAFIARFDLRRSAVLRDLEFHSQARHRRNLEIAPRKSSQPERTRALR